MPPEGDQTGEPASHLALNRAFWTKEAARYAERAPHKWAAREITWGIWGTPESRLNVLGNVAGLDVIDLGCGTGYFSAWLAKRAARPVGIDPTPAQLATAKAMQSTYGYVFPLVEASAESVPFRDEQFDLALSEYGASIWCDPYLWIPEAARLLRPGGRLVFLRNSTILVLAGDMDGVHDRLVRDYFGLHRIHWPDTNEVEFQLGYGDWIRLLHANGFDIEGLIEIQAPEGAESAWAMVSSEWAHRWPSEEIWAARKTPVDNASSRKQA